MMLRISPPLILVFVVTVPISVLFIIYRTKKVRPLFRKRSAKLGELNGFVEEIISGQRPPKPITRNRRWSDVLTSETMRR